MTKHKQSSPKQSSPKHTAPSDSISDQLDEATHIGTADQHIVSDCSTRAALFNDSAACHSVTRIRADGSCVFEWISAGAANVFGYAADELLFDETLWTSRLVHGDCDRTFSNVAELRDTKKPTARTYQFRDKDGLIRIIYEAFTVSREITTKATPDHARNCWIVRSMFIDITQSKHAEDQIHALSKRLELAIRGSGFGVWELELDSQVLHWDDQMHDIYGFDRGTFDGMADTWNACVLPEDKPLVTAKFNELLKGLTVDNFVFRIMANNDASLRYIEANGFAQCDTNGNCRRIVGMNRDVTLQRTSANSLRRTRELLDSSQSLARVGGWEVNLETNTLFWTDETYRIHEVSADDYTPTVESAIRFYTPESQVIITDALRFAQETGSPYSLELELITACDRTIRVQVTCAVSFRQGKLASIFGAIQDITAKHAEQLERERLRAELLHSQRLESIGRLAGGVAHDFNNLLGVILGHTELAMNNPEISSSLRASLVEIQTAAQSSARITRQLLTYARKQPTHPRAVRIDETIRSMERSLRGIVNNAADVRIHASPLKQYDVRIDPTQLEQIVINLAINARDAIVDKGIERGLVEVFVEPIVIHASQHTQTSDIAPGLYSRLTVKDSGIGIDPVDIPHVCEPFFTTKGIGKGTGLGCAIVEGIVRQCDGRVVIESTKGLGTSFHCYFPAYVIATSTREQLITTTPVDANSVRMSVGVPTQNVALASKHHPRESILVVEDQPEILSLITTVLTSNGYTVHAASTPFDALALTEKHAKSISLVLSDVIMPEMNGRELCEAILHRAPKIRVLFMSGFTADILEASTIHEADSQNTSRDLRQPDSATSPRLPLAAHFLQKPFSIAELLQSVRDTLKQAR